MPDPTDHELRCFNADCDETFGRVDDMTPVSGRNDMSPRHFCEGCAKKVSQSSIGFRWRGR